ncbi:hypothetical protein G6F56_000961 [Rhizopus delemar]|nr:hypothetical protein G6F56_000961 [Rhizopus delemar]
MQPLSVLLPQITQTIDNIIQGRPVQDDEDMDRRRSIWDVTENFIYVIWSICEASDAHIIAINRMNIITFLTSFLTSSEHCPTRIVIAAGQCLNTLTDNNRDIFIEFQNHPEYTQSLFNIINNHSNNLVQVLACAILLNIREVINMSGSWDDEADTTSDLHKAVIPILTNALNYDIQEAANKATAAIQSGNVRKENESEDMIAPKPKQPLTAEELYLQDMEDKLSIVQLALELLADICVQDGSEDDGYKDEDEAMADENGEDVEPVEMIKENNDEEIDEWIGNTATAKEIQTSPILRTYIHDVFPQLIRLSTATPISYQSPIPQITPGLISTHQRALECLNNFLLSMNDIPSKFWFKDHVSDATQLWRWLFNLANEISTNKPEEHWLELLEIIIGCLWALGRGLGQDIPLEASDVNALCGSYEQMPEDSSIRVKIVGCLGPIAMRQGDIETNKNIGIFIMNLIQTNSQQRKDIPVLIEALNFIYDVYSDCEFDYDLPVFVQGNFLKALNQLPSVRAVIKSINKRTNYDLRERGDEALINLKAFIHFNIFGHRILVPAALVYVLYVGSYLTPNPGFTIATGAILGIGAGFLWTAQAGIMMSYPDESGKGKAFSIFWMIFNLGATVGAAIPLGNNFNNQSSTVSTGTYIGFMCIMGFGAFLSLALLPAHKVIRADGSPVSLHKFSNWRRELIEIVALFRDWKMLCLIPLFAGSNWFYTYQFQVYNGGGFFSLRARSLNNLVYWLCQIIGAGFFGWLLDYERLGNRKTRAIMANTFVLITLVASWVGAIFVQKKFTFDSVKATGYVQTDIYSENYAGYVILYAIFGLVDAIYQGFIYWLLGTMTNDTERSARYGGFYKTVQNAANAISAQVDALHTPFMTQLIINFALEGFGLAMAYIVCFKVTDVTVEQVDNLIDGIAPERRQMENIEGGKEIEVKHMDRISSHSS